MTLSSKLSSGIISPLLACRVGDHRRGDGEGDRARVDDTDDAPWARRLEKAEERPSVPILCIELDHLSVGVWALDKLHPRIERHALALQEHLHAVDGRVDGVRYRRSALDGRGRGDAFGRRVGHIVGNQLGIKGELERTDVANGDRVWASWSGNDSSKGAVQSILGVDTQLTRHVAR